MKYALQNGYGIEEVDALLGPLIGRPKTALFRLADQVGLNIRNGVAQNLYAALPDGQFRDDLLAPEVIQRMINA